MAEQAYPIHVVSETEAEQCDYVVCADAGTPTPFSDNVETTCAFCAKPVIHRPHAPKRPPKICLDCVLIQESDDVRH
jgi:hypothetical protein